MRCDEAQLELSDARYAQGARDAQGAPDASPELRAHLAECVACRTLSAQQVELDRLLELDEPVALRPGFDTRFFARLAEEKARPITRRRRLFWMLLPLAAGALSALFLRLSPRPAAPPPSAPPPIAENAVADVREVPPDDLALAMDLEMVEDLDVVQKLDEVEDYDVLSQLDADEIERLAREGN